MESGYIEHEYMGETYYKGTINVDGKVVETIDTMRGNCNTALLDAKVEIATREFNDRHNN